MSIFSKILQSTSKNINKALHKEQRGIYNVTYNGKNATTIYKDLEKVDEIIAYTKGNRNKGARHIHLQHSLDSSQQGFVTPDEVANLGQNLRNYLTKHKEPFIDKNGSRVYEWKDDEGNSFRAVVNDMPKKEASGYNSNLPAASEEIITFYSDRNLQNKMIFKNPKLNQSKNADSTLESTTLIKENLPPMMRE